MAGFPAASIISSHSPASHRVISAKNHWRLNTEERVVSTSTKFHGLSGCYFLTAKGQLGSFNTKGQLLLDKPLSDAFAEHAQTLVASYHEHSDQQDLRLGIVHPPDNEHDWHFETMVMEEAVLRELYPSGGQKNAELTSFQKRNKDKSLYRGIELLLDYRKEIEPDAVVYCPVLINRKTCIADYPESLIGRETRGEDVHTPVLEVINFLAPISLSRRVTEDVKALHQSIYDGVVKKELRDDNDLMILQGVHNKIGHEGDLDPDKIYHDHDKRDEREVSVPDDERSHLSGRLSHEPGLEDVTPKKTAKQIRTFGKFAQPDDLRKFEHFKNLTMEQLSEIAIHYPIVTVPSGTLLLNRGSEDDKNFYLLDGAIELMAEDGESKSIRSDSVKAENPIASLKPRKFDVTSVTETRFLWIDEPFIKDLIEGDKAPDLKIQN